MQTRWGFLLIGSIFLPSYRTGPTFTQLYKLKPDEGVFAYARINPAGTQLAYASELPDPKTGRVINRTVTLVDLPTKKILYTERGIDAYFSPDGERIIFSGPQGVTIRHADGRLAYIPKAGSLGDYYSWGTRGGKDLILTIQSNYYYLKGDAAILPHTRINQCPGVGTGDRPLLSKDGQLISTFVKGTVVVRNLTDCNFTFETGLQGAKADFSWDSRYIAFHVAKKNPTDGYELVVIDLKDRTQRRVTSALKGSAFFPSWTKDGRICFRYDGPEYRGFMMVNNPLSAEVEPLPKVADRLPSKRTWPEIFPETPAPAEEWSMVMIWAPWSAHMIEALAAADELATDQRGAPASNLAVLSAVDPASKAVDVARLKSNTPLLRQIPITADRMRLTSARNQIPTTLLFRNGTVVDQHLGPMSKAEMQEWLAASKTEQTNKR